MGVRGLTLGVAGIASVAGLLFACGGYGGGSGGSGYGTPMPTVMFTSPAQASSINLGQGVQLAWTSTYATSCSATTSSTSGGAFSGSQSTSGKATVAPTAPGTVTYTLTCSGAGGMASAMTPVVTVNPSILSTLSVDKITTIGSTLDPIEQGGNP
jgi:hypothetical protein